MGTTESSPVTWRLAHYSAFFCSTGISWAPSMMPTPLFLQFFWVLSFLFSTSSLMSFSSDLSILTYNLKGKKLALLTPPFLLQLSATLLSLISCSSCSCPSSLTASSLPLSLTTLLLHALWIVHFLRFSLWVYFLQFLLLIPWWSHQLPTFSNPALTIWRWLPNSYLQSWMSSHLFSNCVSNITSNLYPNGIFLLGLLPATLTHILLLVSLFLIIGHQPPTHLGMKTWHRGSVHFNLFNLLSPLLKE